MASFFISLDKDGYSAGETVSGEVLLNISAGISGFQGISLQLTGFESVKSVNSNSLPQPLPSNRNQNHSIGDNKQGIALEQIHHSDAIEVSECTSEKNDNSRLRPKVIRTADNKFFQVSFNEQREEFIKEKVIIFDGSKLNAGQYSFPFSFKIFQQWPGSFSYETKQKKARVDYHLTAKIEPQSPHFDFHFTRSIFIIQAEEINEIQRGQTEVSSFFCIKKGQTNYSLQFQNNRSLSSTKNIGIKLSVDNSLCSADVQSINIELINKVSLKNKDQTLSQTSLFTRILDGVRAGEKKVDQNSFSEGILLPKDKRVYSSIDAKLINSRNYLKVTLNYNALFYSAQTQSFVLPIHVPENIPAAPFWAKNNFDPKVMPQPNLTLSSKLLNKKQNEKMNSTEKLL